MDEAVRVTILEDEPSDAELIERELRKLGPRFGTAVVSTREAFRQALRQQRPQLILADYSLPGFDGMEALALAQQQCPETPFILVSGAVGEELAIDSVKQGATDYVLKHRLSRLGPAVERAMMEAREQEARRQAQAALQVSEERHRALLRINNAIIAKRDREQLFAAILAAISDALNVDITALALHDPASDVLTLCSVQGVVSAGRLAVGTEFARSTSHLGWAFDQKRPLLRRDLQRDHLDFTSEQQLIDEGVREYIVVPIVGTSTVLGTVCAASRQPNQYSDATGEFLQAVAGQIALAIENMRAYEEITQLQARLERENLYLRDEIKSQHNFDDIVGESRAVVQVLQKVEQVAPTDATVLICGETGTGKELIARAVHQLSTRRNRPLVKVNCAALPATLIESELFGHERGAFTGAVGRKVGRFELAHGGTIFLDEIGDLPLELQAKLLRVLQEGEFERLGGQQTLKVSVRVIAATNHDLEATTRDGRFRSDLFYRLSVFPIWMPPMRERREDISLLVRHFVKKCASKLRKRIDTIPERTMNALLNYTWPGNVREIENVIERAVILSAGPDLLLDEWLRTPRNGGGAPAHQTLDDIQREHIRQVLRFTGGVVSGDRGAAKILGLKATTLESRMKRLGVQRLGL